MTVEQQLVPLAIIVTFEMHFDCQCSVVQVRLAVIASLNLDDLRCAMAQHDMPLLVIVHIELYSDRQCAIEQHDVPLAVFKPLELLYYLKRWV